MNDILLDRTPPHNLDSEKAVISALFINNSGFDEVDDLEPDNFYSGAHKKIFKAMLSLLKSNEPVDLVTVAQKLEKNNELGAVGGASYLAAIADAAPIATNIAAYAQHVIETSKAREMIHTASQIISKGMDCKNIEKFISESQSQILSIQTTAGKDKFYTMEQLMFDAVDRIESAQASDVPLGLNLGLGILDNYMQVWGSKLILVAGRPGMGKTALAFSIAVHIGHRGHSTGILSIEMDKEQFADRTLSGESDVNGMGFYVPGRLDKTKMAKINMAAQDLSVLPITVNDSTANLEDIRRRCKKFKKMGKELIIIDQLSQIEHEKGLKPYEAISKNCTAIKQLTRELKIPIILLCQLSRKVEDRAGDNRPIMSDLAETGKLEQDADMVLFLFREGYYNKSVHPGNTEINLAKNRQGSVGLEQRVLFRANRSTFTMKSN